MTETVTGGNALYLSIIQGRLVQKVEEGTEGAKERTFERPDGSKGSKWEITHKNLKGFLTKIEFEDVNFGDGKSVNYLKITFTSGDAKAVISTPSDSRYAIDFMKKLPNIDTEQVVIVNTYDFEDDKGKRRTAFDLKQGDSKIYSAFWDNEKKKAIGGIPTVTKKDAASYDNDDWKIHFMKEKKWLIENSKKIAVNLTPVNYDTVEAESSDDGEVDDLPF